MPRGLGTWKIIIPQKFFTGGKVMSTTTGSLCWESDNGRSLKESGFQGHQVMITETPQDEKQKLHSWRAHTGVLWSPDLGKWQWPHKKLGQTYHLLVLEGLLWCGGQLWFTMGRRTLVVVVLGSTLWSQPFWRLLFSHLTQAHPTETAGSSPWMPPYQQPTGWEYSPTHQQTRFLKSSLNTHIR